MSWLCPHSLYMVCMLASVPRVAPVGSWGIHYDLVNRSRLDVRSMTCRTSKPSWVSICTLPGGHEAAFSAIELVDVHSASTSS